MEVPTTAPKEENEGGIDRTKKPSGLFSVPSLWGSCGHSASGRRSHSAGHLLLRGLWGCRRTRWRTQ